MRKIVLAALALTACGEPIPIDIAGLRPDPVADTALVDEAVAVLGLTWEPSTRTRGTIVLSLQDVIESGPFMHTHGGQSLNRKPRCVRASSAIRTVHAVAHELGHQMGLEHVCGDADTDPCPADEDNLMRADLAEGFMLDEDQFEQIEKGRRRLTHCR